MAKPKMTKEMHTMDRSNELIVEPGSLIALSIIRSPEGRISVIVSEDAFADVNDYQVEQVLECVRETIEAARKEIADQTNVTIQSPEYVN